MSWLTNHAVRAGASAVGVAAGLMVLASTSQTPDGFTQASFDGPLSIFSNSAPELQGDVLAIGDGAGDTSELAAILTGPLPASSPNSPYRVAYEAGVGPNSLEASAFPATDPSVSAPTTKQSLSVPSKPVVDSQGRVDCTGAVSCLTDPKTNVTTVTYPDGVVALIQQVNDMTVVAYKTVTESLKTQFEALLPSAAQSGPAVSASPLPAAVTQLPQTSTPDVDPGPAAAPTPMEISASTVRPKIGDTLSPQDVLRGPDGQSPAQTDSITIPAVKPTSPFDVVRDAIGSVVDAVTGHHSASQVRKPVDKTDSPTSQPEPGPAGDPAASAP
jgi:hypothetical protein